MFNGSNFIRYGPIGYFYQQKILQMDSEALGQFLYNQVRLGPGLSE
jgi:hypothetical protein